MARKRDRALRLPIVLKEALLLKSKEKINLPKIWGTANRAISREEATVTRIRPKTSSGLRKR